jgi:polyhydroxyalkanoate synthesis regulator phasin
MQKQVLVLTTSAFILACGAITASAQQTPGGPMMQQPDQQPTMQQMQERVRRLQEAIAQRRNIEDYDEGWDDRSMMRGGHQGWGRGGMGSGMMGPGGGMGPGMGLRGVMGRGNMARILFALMDADGDGTISLDEFRATAERIFKAMDGPDKDGRVTLEEMRAFMEEIRRPARQ